MHALDFLDFCRAMLCIRGTSHEPVSVYVCMSVSVCVCVCLTSRSSTKTAKRRITQTTPHDSPGTLVFGCQRSPRNSTGITPCGAPNTDGVSQNRRLSTNSWLYLENGTTVPVNLRQSWLGQLGTMCMQCIFSLFCISYILSQQRAAHVAFVDCWACKLGHLQPITGHIYN